MPIASINPATGETLRTFEALTDAEIEEKIARSFDAFHAHRRTPFSQRAEKLQRAAELLESEAEKWARIIALEMGKPLKAGIDEARKCANCCRFFAENAERFLRDEIIETDADRSFVRILPIGPVIAIMPWNFPFWQVVRFVAPALMAGNTGLLKHASNVPQCALALEEIFRRSGFERGEFQSLLIGAKQTARVIADSRVRAVTLTGSTRAGAEVASAAGAHIKKVVLELGGSDPFIVMPSADLERAAQIGVKARTVNCGQSCIAAKRFIVHEKIYLEFECRFLEKMRALKIGDPLDDATEIGPLATVQVLRDVEEQVKKSVAAGARLVLGGEKISRAGNSAGNFFAPTILADIPKNSPAYREEIFGPVALFFRVRDIDEAIALANDSEFGLGSSVWTNDETERKRFINEIEAGQTFINAMVASDPRLPFGGVKASGYGRELSREGIREFVNAKSIWIAESKTSGHQTDTE